MSKKNLANSNTGFLIAALGIIAAIQIVHRFIVPVPDLISILLVVLAVVLLIRFLIKLR